MTKLAPVVMMEPPQPRGRPSERVKVQIRRRDRDSITGWIEHDMLWPKGWPLPEVGSIVLAGPIGGFVDHLEFDMDAQRVLIVLR